MKQQKTLSKSVYNDSESETRLKSDFLLQLVARVNEYRKLKGGLCPGQLRQIITAQFRAYYGFNPSRRDLQHLYGFFRGRYLAVESVGVQTLKFKEESA